MANQIIIDIGAVANDGTGDPLRTAFGYVNNNFSNVWASGVANSNIQFDGNRILTTNTNGNLVLSPNGIGKVQANVDIVPNANNTVSLGASNRRWNTVYAQYLEIGNEINLAGDLTVNGNLTVEGDTIQIGNIVTDTKTIQLANTASTANAANGSGVTVGASDDVATMLYSSTSNTWVMNIGANITGNVTAPYFIGNGSLLTGLPASYSNANVVTLLAGFGSNTITTTGNISGGFIFGNISQASGLPATYGNANVANYLPTFSGNISAGNVNAVGNISGTYIKGNGSELTNLPAPAVAQDITSNGAMSIMTYDGTLKYVSYATVEPSSGNISAGNISTTGNVTGNYFIGNGSQLTGVTSYSNANVATYLAGSAGNIIPVGNNAQSLGNATNRWANLWLSGNTIQLGNLSLSAGVDGLTSTTGFDLGNSVATDITANVLSANTVNIGTGGIGIGDDNFLVVETLVPGGLRPSNDDLYLLGNTSHRWSEVHANVYYGDGSQLTGINLATYIIANGNSSVAIPSLDGSAEVIVNDNTWSFDTAGNLTLPGNIIAINYLNGNRVTGGITFDGEAVIGTGTSNTQSGLYLAPDPVSLTNDLYLRVRGNILDEPTHIHFDTGNNQYYNQFIGDDNKYILLANTGNIVVNTNDGVGNSAQWTFNNFGTLTLPGGSQIRPLGANLDIIAGTGSYVNLITSDESSSVGVDNGGGYITTAGGTWDFSTTGNLTAPGNVTVTGNLNVTGTAGNVATKSSGAWTVTPGTNNYSFTVDSSNTYQMWVEGNIANGIIAWNALATITNTNVPVIGQQFAWNYEGAGNPIVFTSIPAQIIGTAGAISNASPAVANTNVFTFGINNTSGSNQTVRYGWVRIS